jgi:sigma-B regulation protein RsbU (phosphoserine phosphatase)
VHQRGIDFSKGDKILLFTDGVIETKNGLGEEYGQERLEKFIKKNHDLDVDLLNQVLLDDLNAFKDGDFKDDIFILSLYLKTK